MSTEPALPWYPWNPSKFRSETLGWPTRAKGIYRELKDLQWEMRGLPAGPQRLRELTGATAADWREAWPLMEAKFPIAADGMRRNQDLEAVRAHAKTVSAVRAAAGRNGGIARSNRAASVSRANSNVVPIAKQLPSNS